MVEVRDLEKVFVDRRGRRLAAVRGVSFTCRPGSVFGLLGRNGAGKTTTLRILATVLAPTSGTAIIGGHDVTVAPAAARARIGFLTGDTRLYDRLTGLESLVYFGQLQGLTRDALDRRLSTLTPRFGLQALLTRRIGQLSSGQKQRLSLVRALLHDPEVIILDEPTTGLDILAARDTVQHIRSLRDEGRTVICSTHNLAEVMSLCDDIGVLDAGLLLAAAPKTALLDAFDGDLERAFVDLVSGLAAPIGVSAEPAS